MDDHYPTGTVRAVIETNLVTPATAKALQSRRVSPAQHGTLEAAALGTLRAVCDRLIPQPDRREPIDLAAIIVDQLASGAGDGWRYADMPEDIMALKRGIVAIDASATAAYGVGFAELEIVSRDRLLAAVQRGEVGFDDWGDLSPRRWFETLLVAATEAYYSHPVAQEEIGYLGMADARGWDDVGLGARAPHEPEPL